jgi:hypothetical protein
VAGGWATHARGKGAGGLRVEEAAGQRTLVDCWLFRWTAGCYADSWASGDGLLAVLAGCQFFLPDWRDHLKTRRESGLLAGQAFFLTCGLSKN